MARIPHVVLAAVVIVGLIVIGLTVFSRPAPPEEVCTYGAARGDTIFSVAVQYSTMTEVIERLNPGIQEPLTFGQLIRVPCGTAPTNPVTGSPSQNVNPAPLQTLEPTPQGCPVAVVELSGKKHFTFGGNDQEIPIGYRAEMLGGDQKVRTHWCKLIDDQAVLTNVGEASAPEFKP